MKEEVRGVKEHWSGGCTIYNGQIFFPCNLQRASTNGASPSATRKRQWRLTLQPALLPCNLHCIPTTATNLGLGTRHFDWHHTSCMAKSPSRMATPTEKLSRYSRWRHQGHVSQPAEKRHHHWRLACALCAKTIPLCNKF